ncbi:unnamed protein product [Paramecium pentaurelia]|uniref:WD domain, G-beta repeat protein n=1 Tax=Paramecium pentaurelia TaxID=43138 RepID=A0A8S1XDH3_9CILI|nr:unnamed protein product [Paramecium pentaurelia]
MQIRCTKADHRDLQIIGVCSDPQCQQQRPYCNFCLPIHFLHLNKLIPQELLNEWIQVRMECINNVQVIISQCNKDLESIRKLFNPYFNFNLEKLNELEISKIDQLIKGLCQIEIFEQLLLQQFSQLALQLQQIAMDFKDLMKNQYSRIYLQEQQSSIITPLIQQQSSNHISQYQQQSVKSLKFNRLKSNSIKQDGRCYAIAFNNDDSFILIGCREKIKVFQHEKGNLKEIQLLNEHKRDVSTLNFMKKTNHFVSGSGDQIIIIWQPNQINQWNCLQKLDGHLNWISCLVLNKEDSLIISGSEDKTIKFWEKQNEFQFQQVITDHLGEVFSLSLNKQENKLISSSKDKSIFVIEKQSLNNKWFIIQKIQLDQYGYRLHFITNQQFIFQPYLKKKMYIYELDINNNLYIKKQEQFVSCGSEVDNRFFPLQYKRLKQILINKNGKSINVMRIQENGEFRIEQIIEFGSCDNYGQLSQDGNYLVTWDSSSRQIQIRICQEK